MGIGAKYTATALLVVIAESNADLYEVHECRLRDSFGLGRFAFRRACRSDLAPAFFDGRRCGGAWGTVIGHTEFAVFEAAFYRPSHGNKSVVIIFL